MMVWYLAQASTEPILNGWVQFGALGVLTGCLVTAVRVLFAREAKSLDHERTNAAALLDAERKRGDRLEGELRDLNRFVQERVVTAMADTAKTLAHTVENDRRGSG